MGLISKAFLSGIYVSTTAVMVLLLSLILSPPPIVIEPKDFRLPLESMRKFEGILKQNSELSKVEKLYSNEIVGPESFATYAGDIYTGTADGLILKFRYGEPLKIVAHIGDDTGCRYNQQRWRLEECGRPLGLRFDSFGNLYVLDAYNGIKRVDVKTGFVELVCDVKKFSSVMTDVTNIFIDDFIIEERSDANNNIFYISDASSKWTLEFVNHVVLDADTSGRLLKCDSSNGKIEILIENLQFPNGLEWTPNRDAILINELNQRRILKYSLKGDARGRVDILVDNLPGFPDNIKISASNRLASDKKTDESATYWVALYEGFDAENLNPIYKLLQYVPLSVKVASGTMYNFGLYLYSIGVAINQSSLQQLGYEIKSMIIYQKFWNNYGLILKINSKGEILQSFHSPDGATGKLSEVFETIENGKKVLYLGSYFNNYIGRLIID